MSTRFNHGDVLRFISTPHMIRVTPDDSYVAPWRERLRILFTGRVRGWKVEPHPELVQISRREFVGHPVTVEAAKQEIAQKQRDEAARREYQKRR